MKLDKSNFAWIFTCIVLSILLGLSLYLGISGWFFKNENAYTTDLEIGKTIQIDIGKNQANAVSLNLDGSYLEGERLAQIISVKSMEDEQDLYLRAKIFVYTSDNQTKKMDIVETVNWTFDNEDNYFYFNDILNPNNKISLCSYLIVGEGSKLISSKKYIVTVVIESLDKTQDVEKIWGKNPIQID